MYKIIAYEPSVEKDYDIVTNNLSENVLKRMEDFLKNTPQLGFKRMQFRKYNLPNAYRVLYVVLGEISAVRIVCIGDHSSYMRYLKKYGKKK